MIIKIILKAFCKTLILVNAKLIKVMDISKNFRVFKVKAIIKASWLFSRLRQFIVFKMGFTVNVLVLCHHFVEIFEKKYYKLINQLKLKSSQFY